MLLRDDSARKNVFKIAPEVRFTSESLAQAIDMTKSFHQPSPWASWHYADRSSLPSEFRRNSTHHTAGAQVRKVTGTERVRLLDENADCEDGTEETYKDWWARFSCRNMQTILSCIVILVFAMIAVIILVLLVPLSTQAISLVNEFDSASISDHIDAVFEHTLKASLRAEAAASYMLNASHRTYDMVDAAEPALTTAITAGQSLAKKAKEFSEHPSLTIAG